MKPSADKKNMFETLGGVSTSNYGTHAADGCENYLTQITARVLAEDPSLVRKLLQEWVKISPDGKVEVFEELALSAGGAKTAIVDMAIQAGPHWVFVENKTGSELNVYTDGPDGTENQVDRYARALSMVAEPGHRHLLVLTRKAIAKQKPRDSWRGAFFWWELHDLVRRHLSEQGRDTHDSRAWLQRELLGFLEKMDLAPPQPLRPESVSPIDAGKLFAEAAREYEPTGMSTVPGGVWLVEPGRNDAYFGLTPAGGQLAYVRNEGRRLPPPLGNDFWQADVPTQITTLLQRLKGVSSFPSPPSAPWETDELLALFGDDLSVAREIVALLSAVWPDPSRGDSTSANPEFSFRHGRRTVMRLRPTWTSGVLILTVGAKRLAAVRMEVERLLGRELPRKSNAPKEQLNIPLRFVRPGAHTQDLIRLAQG